MRVVFQPNLNTEYLFQKAYPFLFGLQIETYMHIEEK